MVLNMADFVKSWKSLQTLWKASKTVLKLFVSPCATFCLDSRCICKGWNLADFEQKAWGIAHGFEHGRFFQLLEIVRNSLKRLQNRSKMTASATVCVDFRWIRKCRKLADFEQRAWPIAHGFEHGRFFQLLEIVRNSLKPLQNNSKMICECFRDCFCRFRVNSKVSKIGRFWAKGLGYSPWFWTWPIFSTPGNRSKLSETPPKPF